ncbi:MAG: hypothetical protein KA146_11320 [Leptospiraceae bacterium]|jgi:hypothetical protein|nr:hypothetical protein [Leptospiraceae bacterium]
MISERFSVDRKADKIVYSYDRYDHFSFVLMGVSLYFIVDYILNFRLDKLTLDSLENILGIIFFAIPVFFLYSTIDTSFNSTVVTLTPDFLFIAESPIPIQFTKKIKRSDISNVITKTETFNEEGTWQHHYIFVRLRDNREISLFKLIAELREAKSIESILNEDLVNWFKKVEDNA